MSSPYPILDNRPIDKWKVTELKEELKRRKLTTRGLKEDLVKRLDEALRMERENAESDDDGNESVSEGEKDVQLTPATSEKSAIGVETTPVAGETTPAIETTPVAGEMPPTVKTTPVADETTPMAVETTPVAVDTTLMVAETTSVAVETTSVVEATPVVDTYPLAAETAAVASDTDTMLEETGVAAAEAEVNLVRDACNMDGKADDVKVQVDINDPVADLDQGKVQESPKNVKNIALVDEEPVVQAPTMETVVMFTESTVTESPSGNDLQNSVLQGGKGSNAQKDTEGSKPRLDVEDLNAQPTDVPHAMSAPNKQVSEVSPSLGIEVKSDSISTDSVSINENIELKDNIIADNAKLENSVLKSEMVEPSSRDTEPVGGGSHPMDVEEPLAKKNSTGERDDNNSLNADMTEKNDNVDVAYSEKLNLDRSSGDESMEEDVLESKEIDSKNNSGELGDMSEKSKVNAVKEQRSVDVVGSDFPADKGEHHVDKTHPEVISEKRKLDQAVGNNEPLKRQRRWNSGSTKVPEAQENAYTTAAKDSSKSVASKPNFSRSNSTASGDGQKERVVPPSEKAPTNSLRIDHFLRPFTLKAVQELLGKTGTVTSFWMDHIKTHCYVTYATVEEAVETRNSVYNLQWPPNGGRLLLAEFVEPQEVKARLEGPPTPTAPSGSVPTATPSQPKSQPPKQQLPVQPAALPPPPPLSNLAPVRERLPPPPPVMEKQEPPIVTLDDLFKKTKATPRIYYLPLSEEQVAVKLAARGRNA